MSIHSYSNGERVEIKLGESVCAYLDSHGRACWSPQGHGFGLFRVVDADFSRPIWDDRGPANTTSLVIDGKTQRLVLVSEHRGSKPFADMDMTRVNGLGGHTDPRLTEEVA